MAALMLTCVAIDDEPLALKLLQGYAQKLPHLQLLRTFEDAITAAEYLRQQPVDLLFTDINMPDISGIDLIKSLPKPPMIIFTTAYKKFAVDGFELDALDYLVKPFAFDRFKKAVDKASSLHQLQQSPSPDNDAAVYVRSEYKLIRVMLSDIQYIESLEDYLKIHLHSSKPIMTLMTMKAMQEKLSNAAFIRIHRSYLVPLVAIATLTSKKVQLVNGQLLPVGDSYAVSVQQALGL